MRRKNTAAVFLLLIALTLPAACSGVARQESPSSRAALENGTGDDTYNKSGGGYTDENGIRREAPGNTEERKIIWDASMELEAEDAAGLHGSLASRAAELGGYEYGNNIRHYEEYSVVSATFKVPPENIHEFMAYAGEAGKIVNSALGSEDVTEGYYDAEIRLDTKRKSLERYYELLADAQNVNEIVYIQGIIDGITEEIESLEGRLRVWDVLTDMATVRVTIRQKNDPIKLKREINWKTLTAGDMGYLIKSGFVAVSGAVLAVLQWIAIVLLAAAPLWVVIVLAVFLLFRRRKKRREALQNENPEPPGEE
ncbi:MAG: DUF4349 domain-containing protein [Oscillospiraceae bacterium]|jgi:hypothetical protein|nr:DUF4349 domain-containing protein [Oscillospiraceae bacterium]